MEGKEGRKNAEKYSGNKRQLIIHVVYNSFGSQKSQDILLLHSKKKKSKKKFLYCPTFSPLQCTMESRVTNCLDFTGKGHVLKQFISCHPDTPQAAFPPKAKKQRTSQYHFV